MDLTPDPNINLETELKTNLELHLQEIARDRDPLFSPLGHLYVQTYIRQQWEQWGEVTDEAFEFSGTTYCNLILDLPAAAAAKTPPILIGAHYDAVHASPGADDNATGVAVLLELARVFAQSPSRAPLRLVAFDAEEYGRLGSQVTAQLLAEEQQPLRLMLSLEMLGYCDPTPGSQNYPAGLDRFFPNRGDFLALVGNLKTIPDLWRCRHHLRQCGMPCEILPIWNQGHPIPRLRDSDHAAFWDAGYNAILVTDTADLRNPHYHQGSDRLETLNLDFLTRATTGLIQAIRHL